MDRQASTDRPTGADDQALPTEPDMGGPRPLPQARLRPPALRTLRRDRLLRAAGAGPGQRLTLVTGPAGSGKTTLLSQVVTHHPGPTAWYRADVDDVAPEVLLSHISQALATVVPDLPDRWQTVDDAVRALDTRHPGHPVDDTVRALDTRQPGQPGPRRHHAEPTSDRPTVLLAVDDLHVIVGSEAEHVLGDLVDALPPWLHLAATCRAAPRWNLSRLRVSGALVEVDADDLRFRSWEVERLFCDVYGEPLPPGDLAQLTHGLEGWAAGLQLFHLATRDKPVSERRRAVASLPARSKLVREYLSGNVLDGLPEDQTTFLVDTSILGRLTPSLCDELRGTRDSRRMLDELESRQVFVTRLDGDDAYRYHEVFRSYLERRLVERYGEADARARAGRAAELLEAEGHLADALRAHCRAADWTSVGRVLEKGGAELAADPGDWLDALPRSLVDDDAWVMLATARRAVATGRFDAALGIYARVDHSQTSASAEAACRRERSALAAWLDPAAPPPAEWTGQVREALRHPGPGPPPTARRPPPGAPAGQHLAAGIVLLVHGRIETAAHVLTALADDPETSDVLAAAARLALGVAHALAPDRVAHLEPAELLELVEVADVPWLAWMAKAAGSLQAGAPDGARAREVAHTLGRQGDAWGSALARLVGTLGAARSDRQLDPAELHDLDHLGDDLRRLDAPVLAVWADAWQASVLARAGRHDDARARSAAAAAAAARHGVPAAQVWALETGAQLVDGDRADELIADAAALRRRNAVDVAVPTVGRAGPAPVRVQTLGGFALEVDGRPVDLGGARPRVRSVLHYLAAQAGRPVHGETIAGALWPDVDATAAKRSLQVALSSLRKQLEAYPPHGEGLIRRDGPSYALALPDGSDHDLVTVAAALADARAAARAADAPRAVDAGRRALAAYAGDLLPEEGPVDWAVERRRTLGTEAVDAAVLVAEQALATDQPDAAVAACVRGLEIDRYHDGLWRLQARAHVAGGDLAAAARTRERYRSMLGDLGLDLGLDGGLGGGSDQALAQGVGDGM